MTSYMRLLRTLNRLLPFPGEACVLCLQMKFFMLLFPTRENLGRLGYGSGTDAPAKHLDREKNPTTPC